MQVAHPPDGVTVINDAYNANPDSMEAGLKALAWMASAAGRSRDCGAHERRRSWAVLGEMAELGDDTISEHDRIGRLAVRLDVSVDSSSWEPGGQCAPCTTERSWRGRGGPRRPWSSDADAALALLRAEVRPGDVVLVKASNAAGLGALADALARAAAR